MSLRQQTVDLTRLYQAVFAVLREFQVQGLPKHKDDLLQELREATSQLASNP